MSDEIKKLDSINVSELIDKKTVLKKLDQPLFTVIGTTYEIFDIKSKRGMMRGFKGDFCAVVADTGEVFESDAIFLPKNFTGQLSEKLLASEQGYVGFKVTVSATASDKNDEGYAWITSQPRTPEMDQRREEARAAAMSESKRLAAPTAAKSAKKAA